MAKFATLKKFITVSLTAGEQKEIPIPEVTPGDIEVRLLSRPGNLHTNPPTPPNVPGRNVSIGLFYNGRGSMALPALPLNNVKAKADKRDNLWVLKIKNTQTNVEDGKKFYVLIFYPSTSPIITKTIPMSFFQRSFDEFWNNYRPIENIRLNYDHDDKLDGFVNIFGTNVPVYSNKVTVKLNKEIAWLYNNNKDVIIEKLPALGFSKAGASVYAHLHDINLTRITVSAIDNSTLPIFRVKTFFETSGPTEVSVHWDIAGFGDSKAFDISGLIFNVDISLSLLDPPANFGDTRTDKNFIVSSTTNFDLSPNYYIDLPDPIDNFDITGTVESKVKGLVNANIQSVLNQYTSKVLEFLLGEIYPILDLKMADGNIIIQYIGNPGSEDFDILFKPGPKFIPQGNLSKIDHIVVLMMENRSFDHMLGYLTLEEGRRDIDGLIGDEFNIDPKGRKVFVNRLHNTQMMESPCHDSLCVLKQVMNNPPMSGFLINFAERYYEREDKWNEVMGYYGKQEVPTFHYLSNEFAVLDKWFCAHPGPTLPNRFITFTGKLDNDKFGNPVFDNYDFSNFTTVEAPTIFDYLNRHGVSWKLFEHGYSFIRSFTRYTYNTTNVLPIDNAEKGFYALAKQGKLPSVSFIEPDYIDVPPGNDDHPPADIAKGQSFMSKVIRALQDSPQWEKTMLIITYDEHGGFYDHVPPTNNIISLGFGIMYGPRVPAFVISPWVPAKSVSHDIFDHTSILTTIRRRFIPPTAKVDLGPRVIDSANDLGALLSLKKPRLAINKITELEYRGQQHTFKMKPPSLLQNDFHETLFGLRIFLGYPPR